MSNDRHFRELLAARNAEGKHLCVGLDPDMERIKPLWAEGQPKPVSPSMRTSFLRDIVLATAPLVAAFKPNRSFYEGVRGVEELQDLIRFINQHAPEVPVILDVKYGDIGQSNKGYETEAFDNFAADAMTVHNYLGGGTWIKTLKRPDKCLFFLCRTSNPEASEFQDEVMLVAQEKIGEVLPPGGAGPAQFCQQIGWQTLSVPAPAKALIPYYEYVAFRMQYAWNRHGTAGLVVGATAPNQLARVRKIAPDLPILIPGVGTQGGRIEDVVPAVGSNFLINASSSILYAFEKREGTFPEAALAEAEDLHQQIQAALGLVGASTP